MLIRQVRVSKSVQNLRGLERLIIFKVLVKTACHFLAVVLVREICWMVAMGSRLFHLTLTDKG